MDITNQRKASQMINSIMKHPLCYVALICGIICYVQRCIENPLWIKRPIMFVTLSALMVPYIILVIIVCNSFFTSIGWIDSYGNIIKEGKVQ